MAKLDNLEKTAG